MEFRNTQTIISDQGVEIEEGFLWDKKGDIMVLNDDDQYITSKEFDKFDKLNW